MKLHRLRALPIAAIVTGTLAAAAPLSAQEISEKVEKPAAEAEPTQADSKKTSAELRFTIVSPSARWSKVETRSEMLAKHAERSLYYGPGIGARVFIRQPHHGLLVDFDYRIDTDIDSLNSDSEWKTDFAVARVGYAYRFIRHANERMVWTFTPHASFSAGGSIARSHDGPITDLFSARSAVIGGRWGVNVDFHIERFLMGWAIEYELLGHVRGAPLELSHFLQWTLIPVFRIGVDLGPTIQSLAH